MWNIYICPQIEENLLAKEHAEVFMEKVAEVIQAVKEHPDQVPPEMQATASSSSSIIDLQTRIEMRERERAEEADQEHPALPNSESSHQLQEDSEPRVCSLYSSLKQTNQSLQIIDLLKLWSI